MEFGLVRISPPDINIKETRMGIFIGFKDCI